ncbi:MAG: hypothetical protein KME35_24080 [Aphanocapsa sp. GSE-SYN-MK-11-07L]|jgi:hypothetical protein|nr:hypothetical protein [Aphanocapsa sp. GSE-SYN-MK-11-07L]
MLRQIAVVFESGWRIWLCLALLLVSCGRSLPDSNQLTLMAVSDRLSGLKYSGLPSRGLWNIAELMLEKSQNR